MTPILLPGDKWLDQHEPSIKMIIDMMRAPNRVDSS